MADSKSGKKLFAGMKVLVVDDNVVCLALACRVLRRCNYNGWYSVTECREAKKALEILREKKEYFDFVITDVQMPDMDGLQLLEHMSLELDLPVIMVSADLSSEMLDKGTTHGACDFIQKPINMDSIKHIGHHALRRKKMTNNDNNNKNKNRSNTNGDNENNNECASRSMKKRKDVTVEETGEDGSKKSNVKKAKRFHWTRDLHKLFLLAIEQLGGSKGAVPKKILGIMNVPGLRRTHVASHLQKHRQAIEKLEIKQQDQFCKIQTSSNHHLIGQQINFPHLKPLTNHYNLSRPSSFLRTQNSPNPHALAANPVNTNALLANSNMSIQPYSSQQQQQLNNILINDYQANLRNSHQFDSNTNNGYGALTPSIIYMNNGGNNGSDGNGLTGVNNAGLMPTGHAVDGLESSNSNLTTYSYNCCEAPNNPDWCMI